jgi:phosphotransferase system enzyme I (PtsI)
MGKPFIYLPELPRYESFSHDKVVVKNETESYRAAVERSKKELSKVFSLAKEKLDGKNLMIFEAQLSFLEDEIFHKKVIDRIKSEKKPAYIVFSDEIKANEEKLISSHDEYIRERVSDLEDIKARVLRNIVKQKLFSKIEENCIVVARNLTPADTILFSSRKLLGFATELGGTTSHVAILARSLNLPAVVGIGEISTHISQSDFLIIDGYKGLVIKNPSGNTIQLYKAQIKKNIFFEKSLREVEKLKTETKDGVNIILNVNLEFNKELDYVVTHTGCGVGLYRTEHMFLAEGDFPTEEAQTKQYRMIAERLYPKQVTIRTFDIGGDKLLPESQKEDNPFLGWRGIRICLDKPDVFLAQLRAILRASKKGNVKIMFPMISSLDEVLKVKQHLEQAKSELKHKHIQFDEKIEIGIMIEVPSVLYIADSLAKEVDFFSIGTNDLVQYLLAVDRDSNLVSNLYQKFHPAVVRALASIVKSAQKNNISLSICGEMAGDPYATILLIGLGIGDLSVESTAFLRIKKLIRSIKFTEAKKIASNVLKMNNEKEIKDYLIMSYNDLLNITYERD